MVVVRHRARQGLVLLAVALVLSSCANWHGIANVPMPGGPGSGPGSYTVYVQMPDTLALNDNSRVRVADVFVGTVRAIKLRNWVATLTLSLDKSVKLPKNATAKIGQTSLLGSQTCGAGGATQPVPGAVEGRRHHPAEEFVCLPLDGADTGQSRPDIARRRHPEPRSAAERDLQCGDGGPTRSVPSSASWTPSPPDSTSNATTSPEPSIPPTGCWRTWVPARTFWIACSPNSRH